MEEWGLSRNIKPGYRSLFYGPPGTGKTMVAGLIGIRTESEVYRVDLSQVVSKYIGETEKNLSRIFDRAEHQKWILFFDEADSLFGQRTQTKSSNDRYSNQEVSYLLQRIEDYDGVIILATNLKENIDEAFTRRFQSVIQFPVPGEQERFKLWKKILGDSVPLSDDIDLNKIAANHSITGGSIINVVRFGALRAVQRKNGEGKMTSADLEEGLRRELKKQGKSIL
jgi:SpoVK/Ycf46/Vps4 family AAA+-type ATPase